MILLNMYMHYNTYWRPAATACQILVPIYKSIADIEDIGQLMPACLEPVCNCDQRLACQSRLNGSNYIAHWYKEFAA
jgi:hypothetical protein